MAHHVQVTVPPEHAPAVHEALLSAYGEAAETVADAAGHRDPDRLRDAREALLAADATVAGFGWSGGPRLDAAQLAGSGLFVHRVLGAAVEDASGSFALCLQEYARGEASLAAVAGALSPRWPACSTCSPGWSAASRCDPPPHDPPRARWSRTAA